MGSEELGVPPLCSQKPSLLLKTELGGRSSSYAKELKLYCITKITKTIFKSDVATNFIYKLSYILFGDTSNL